MPGKPHFTSSNCGSSARTIRIARSRTSGANLLGLPMAPSFPRNGASGESGAVQALSRPARPLRSRRTQFLSCHNARAIRPIDAASDSLSAPYVRLVATIDDPDGDPPHPTPPRPPLDASRASPGAGTSHRTRALAGSRPRVEQHRSHVSPEPPPDSGRGLGASRTDWPALPLAPAGNATAERGQ